MKAGNLLRLLFACMSLLAVLMLLTSRHAAAEPKLFNMQDQAAISQLSRGDSVRIDQSAGMISRRDILRAAQLPKEATEQNPGVTDISGGALTAAPDMDIFAGLSMLLRPRVADPETEALMRLLGLTNLDTTTTNALANRYLIREMLRQRLEEIGRR